MIKVLVSDLNFDKLYNFVDNPKSFHLSINYCLF